MVRMKLIVMLALVVVMASAIALAQSGHYLAIYINKDTLHYAIGKGGSLEEASRIAAESCGEQCQRACYSKNKCAALAVAKEGTCWACRWGKSREAAEQEAMKACEESGCDCRIATKECYQ